MTWRETKRVDEVVIYEGPANDTFIIEWMNDDPTADEALGLNYSTWAWSGAIQDEDGVQVGTIDCYDIRPDDEIDNDYILKFQGQSVITTDLIPGQVYYGGIRGVDSNNTGSTLIEFELHAGRILVP